MKTIIVLIVVVSLITVSSNLCAISASEMNRSGDSYHFTDVDVLVFGRCRTISSDGAWHGGIYMGQLQYARVLILNESFGRLTVILKNQSTGETFYHKGTGCYSIELHNNVTGVFFWGRKGALVTYFPPIVFIKCHAEKLTISEGPWD